MSRREEATRSASGLELIDLRDRMAVGKAELQPHWHVAIYGDVNRRN